MFDHRAILQRAKEYLYDKLKRDWVAHFETLALQDQSLTGAAAETESLTNNSQLQMGWALHKKCASARFNQKV